MMLLILLFALFNLNMAGTTTAPAGPTVQQCLVGCLRKPPTPLAGCDCAIVLAWYQQQIQNKV